MKTKTSFHFHGYSYCQACGERVTRIDEETDTQAGFVFRVWTHYNINIKPCVEFFKPVEPIKCATEN